MATRSPSANRFGPVQPGTHIDYINDLTDDESLRQDIPEEDDLNERERIRVIYETRTPDSNSLDALHDERVSNVESKRNCGSKSLVTVDIEHGDLFRFTHASGTWKFVGTNVVDDQTMLFFPADEEAREAPLYPAYRTYLRADFAAKLGGRRDSTIERVRSPTDTACTDDCPDDQPGFFTRIGQRLDAFFNLD
jgi:hypothetical protein